MKIKYFDRAIEWLFMSLVFLLPLIFDRRIGIVFSGTKSATVRLFLLVILTVWAVKLLAGGKHAFKRTILDWPVLSYVLAATAAALMSVNVIISISGFYGRYEGLVTWYSYALMFFIASNYFRGFEKLKRLIAVVAPAAASMAVYGIIQRQGADPYVWGGVVTWQRVIATIGQPNFLSAYMDMSFFLLMFFLLTSNNKEQTGKAKARKNEKQDWALLTNGLLPFVYYISTPILFVLMIFSQTGQAIIAWYAFFAAMTAASLLFAYNYHTLPDFALKFITVVSLVLIYVCNFYTQSRGGYLAFGAGLVVFIALIPRQRLIKYWKLLSLVALALILISGITAINPENSPFARFAGEIKVKGEEIKQGPEKSDMSVELSGAAGSRGETWKSAFGIIADNPVFGIGPEVLKMVFPRYETDLFRFKEAFHVKQDRCHNETFDVPVTKGLIAFFLYIFILLSVFAYGFKMLKTVDDDRKVMLAAAISAMASYLIQNQFSFGVIAITSLFWVLWAVVINIDSEGGQEDEREINFDDIPWLPVGMLLIALLFFGWISLLQFEADKEFKTGKTLLEMRRFGEAAPKFKVSLGYFPYEGGTITHLGISLLNSSMSAPPQDQKKIQDEALSAFAYGMRVDPYNADNFYISSRIYLMQGNAVKAVEMTQKALKIDPYYAEAYLSLAAIAEKTGSAKDAQRYYGEAFRINPNLGEPKLKVAFKKLSENKLDEAFQLFHELLVSDPKNPDVHKGLGQIYLKRGDRVRANEEFDYVKQLRKK